MADKQLRVHGVVEPKGTAWLKEVRLDAARNTIEQLRQQKEAQEFQAAKARGITTEEIIAKGKQDLADDDQLLEVVEPSLQPQAELEEEVTEPKGSAIDGGPVTDETDTKKGKK